MIALLALAAAHAQAVPETSVQLWRLPIDAENTLWTEEAIPSPDGYRSVRGALSYARDPLVYAWEDGDVDHVLKDAFSLDLAGGFTKGPVRFGLGVPLWLYTDGEGIRGGAGLGDIAAEVRGVAVDGHDGPIGVAGTARLIVPTATNRAPVGNRGLSAELVGVVTANAGDARLSGNLGVRVQPKADLADDGLLNEKLFVRVGGGVPVSATSGVSLDVGGEFNLAGLPAEGTPFEAIVGGWHREGDLVLRGGVGAGLTAGIGAPVCRVIFTAGYEPPRVWDADKDGIIDELDECIDDPEDFDTWKDADGCPDPLTEVHVFVRDHQGRNVPGATVVLDGSVHDAPEGYTVELLPGAYPLRGDGSEHQPADATLSVTAGPPIDYVLELEHDVGKLTLTVTDPAGQPVIATVRVKDTPGVPDATLDTGSKTFTLLPAEYTMVVSAEGYLPTTFPVEVIANETTPFTVVLHPRRVTVTRERLVITDKIYFEFNKAIIKSDSFDLMDEITATLRDHPEITAVSIEGHTDSRGSASSNLKLSTARAAAVRTYLVEHGIEASRLVSAGYGESRPVDKHENEAAWELNRRVEFVITGWAP